MPCCSLCNAIKGSLIFDSLRDIQDYLLDRLLDDGSITLEHTPMRMEHAVERSTEASSNKVNPRRKQLQREVSVGVYRRYAWSQMGSKERATHLQKYQAGDLCINWPRSVWPESKGSKRLIH